MKPMAGVVNKSIRISFQVTIGRERMLAHWNYTTLADVHKNRRRPMTDKFRSLGLTYNLKRHTCRPLNEQNHLHTTGNGFSKAGYASETFLVYGVGRLLSLMKGRRLIVHHFDLSKAFP